MSDEKILAHGVSRAADDGEPYVDRVIEVHFNRRPTDDEVRALADFLRAFPGEPPPPKPGWLTDARKRDAESAATWFKAPNNGPARAFQDRRALLLLLDALPPLLTHCAEKLELYRAQHSGEYVGGIEYTELQRRIAATLEALR